MLVIRLRRIGKKNKPTYRVVVAEHSYPINGKFMADLGFYNPHTKGIGLKVEDVKLWLSKGAKPSNTVSRLLLGEKMKHPSIVFEKRNRKPKSEPTEKPAAAPAAAEPTTEATEEAPAPDAPEAVETPETEETTSENA
jgi:small subunit ribosomal protein S16